ncbi:Sulfide-quinone reductase [Metallosphaera sp. J1]|uniref:NAD(P)/FAD-dependent oxidoreductase n=1 Tax=Metallosphaera javensis (ex Hofmann et al. 2022) TaxID=99938 RepID=UPI001EE0EA5C|nr:FAD-dependent oxidoreductase [Metallosphaera javensis (ex Hofmann et al. 2022)]MCG3109716.1 Sulfide-quinone reductase [Metallosphaera javensis (ex Hofmann et al. 2022)]
MKFLILGAGYAGLTVAHKLRRFLGDEVTVISESRVVRENTIFPLLLTDEVKVEETEFDAKLAMERKGVNFVEARVSQILPESREVKTDRGTFDYDYLFLALGGGYEENFRRIPGHENAVMHHTLDGFLKLKELLWNTEGDVFVGNAPGSPIEGPSYQVALIAEYITRKRGLKRKVYLATQSPKGVFGPIPQEWVHEKANSYFERRGIQLLKGKSVKEIRKGMVILNDGQEVEAEVISVLPSLSAPKVVRDTGIAGSSGFVEVKLPSFRKDERIFALGDLAQTSFPRTARAAMISAENAVSTVLKEIRGLDLPMYSLGVLCVMEGGDDGGILRFDTNGKETKTALAFSRTYVMIKKMYSRLLVNRAFDVPYHGALTIEA